MPPKLTNWVRTGGAIGDESMQEQYDFQKSGAGVVEGAPDYCGNNPNEGVQLEQQKGAE